MAREAGDPGIGGHVGDGVGVAGQIRHLAQASLHHPVQPGRPVVVGLVGVGDGWGGVEREMGETGGLAKIDPRSLQIMLSRN